VARNVLSQQEL
jgi:hypothetical protein